MLISVRYAECDGCGFRLQSKVIPAAWLRVSQLRKVHIYCTEPCFATKPGSLSRKELSASRAALWRLSSTDVAILVGVAQGLQDKEIGWKLHLSPETIKNHLSGKIARAFGTHGRVETLIIADAHGLIDLHAIGSAMLISAA